MTKADRDFVELTAELAATKAVAKMREDHCSGHSSSIAAMRPVIESNTKAINGNRKGIDGNRKMYFIGIGVLFLGLIGERLAKIFI